MVTDSMRGLLRPQNEKYFDQQRLPDPVSALWGQRR